MLDLVVLGSIYSKCSSIMSVIIFLLIDKESRDGTEGQETAFG